MIWMMMKPSQRCTRCAWMLERRTRRYRCLSVVALLKYGCVGCQRCERRAAWRFRRIHMLSAPFLLSATLQWRIHPRPPLTTTRLAPTSSRSSSGLRKAGCWTRSSRHSRSRFVLLSWQWRGWIRSRGKSNPPRPLPPPPHHTSRTHTHTHTHTHTPNTKT